MKARRELAAALTLLAVGGIIAVLAAGRMWVQSDRACFTADACKVATARGPIAPVVAALGVAALAGTVAVLASRGRGRRIVGAALAAVGAAIVAAGATALVAPQPDDAWSTAARDAQLHATNWPILAAAGGVAVAAAGLIAAVRGSAWHRMSERYDGPQAAPAASDVHTDSALWDALSRGDDPT